MNMRAFTVGLLMMVASFLVMPAKTMATETETAKSEALEVSIEEKSIKEKNIEEKNVDILFLNDVHSYVNGIETVEDEETQILGGFSRIKTLINEQKEKNADTLLLDAGDFSMGTLIQVVFEEEASELRLLGEMGFEATTLGNHEFDYRSSGLANMMNRAVESGETLPSIVLCNVDWESMEKAGLTKEQKMLYDAFKNYGVKDYIVTEKNGIKIAVTGVFGKESLEYAPTCVLTFEDPVEAVKKTVDKIREKEKVDMIVCVSHSGTSEEEKNSEDEILAKNVPKLDLIISGHSHTKLEEPIIHGDTYIVSAKEYGKYLGSLSMSQKENGRWKMDTYKLIPVVHSIAQDEKTQKRVDDFMAKVDKKYLNQFGYSRNQILCTNEITFAKVDDLYEQYTELNLGSIIADSYAYGVEQVAGDEHPVDVALVPAGTVRDTYTTGNITVENVFQSFSLGIGEDRIPGYPLISAYLTGAELKTVAEIDASISRLMPEARLYSYGLCWSYNPHRMILNKVTDVWLCDREGQRIEIEDDKLYRVVVDYYTSQILSSVTEMSYGLLSLVPKFADGIAVANFADTIVMDGEQELKAWVTIAKYMESFEDTDGDGIGNIPKKYSIQEGRKEVEDSRKLSDLLKHPNKFFFMIIGVMFVVVLVAVLIVILLVKCVKLVLKKSSRK